MPSVFDRPLPTILGPGLFFLLALAGFACNNLADDAAIVSLRNDTSGTLIVRQCNVDCRRIDSQSQVAAGASVSAGVSPRGEPTWWQVADASGTTLGCVRVAVEGHPADAVFNLSQTEACPPDTGYGSNDALAIAVILLFIGVPALVIVAPLVFVRWRRKRRAANSPG